MSQFFKQTIASTIGSLIGLLLFLSLGIGGLGLLILSAMSVEEEFKVENKSILVFDLSVQIRDSQPPANLSQVISGEDREVMTLRRVLQAIEKATNDDRIVGMFLDGRKGGSGGGYANTAEVRTALEKFRAKGKKIIAYDVTLSEREYYLSSLADEIVINPMGVMELNGLSSKQMFFKDALDKYGVGVQIIRVGDYKSAVEPYTRSDFSEENREQTLTLLNDLWEKFLTTTGESRGVKTTTLQKVADKYGFLDPRQAQKVGLIDKVGYYDNVAGELRKLTGEPKEVVQFRQISLKNYAERALPPRNTQLAENKVAVVYAEGAIVGGKGTIETIGSDRFAREFRELREDTSVKAIVLRVNSPGGSATASEEILREILLTKKKKPVVVSMGNVAASGGYWIAAGANQIFAEENTITGSIGVFGMLSNIQEIANKHGVTWDTVKTARFADIGSNFRPKTDEELEIYQKSVAKTYNLFIRKVAKYRNIPPEQVKKIAKGRIWSGKKAAQIGLVDRIGGLEEAIAFAAKEAKLDKNWEIEEYPQQNRFETEVIERLLNIDALEKAGQINPATAEFLRLEKDLAVLFSFSNPHDVYARLPFSFEIE